MGYLFQQLLNGLALGSTYALIALGFSIVYGILRLLNFAHSELITTGAYAGLFFVLVTQKQIVNTTPISIGWLFLSALAAGLAGALVGVILELVAYRPLKKAGKVSVLLSAVGMSIVLQDIGIHLFGAKSIAYGGVVLPFNTEYVAPGFLVLLISILWIVMKKTRLGIWMRAVSDDAETCRLLGINAGLVKSATFFIGGFFAGVAGLVWGIQYNTINPQMGFLPGLKAFSIAVVGTIGNTKGCVIVGLGLGVIEVLLQAFLPSTLSGTRDAVAFFLLILVLFLRPTGLFREQKT
jgi:branched-chain amino acid transport system permease protein